MCLCVAVAWLAYAAAARYRQSAHGRRSCRMTDQDIARRAVEILGPRQGAEVVKLADALSRDDADALAKFLSLSNGDQSEPPPRKPRSFAVSAAQARAAGGTASHAFNVKIIRETVSACTSPDTADFKDSAKSALAALAALGPRDAFESHLASLLVAAQTAAMECFQHARVHGLGTPLGEVLIGQADRLTGKCIELADAFARRRGKGEQRIVVQHIHGGQAIGMVNAKTVRREGDGRQKLERKP